MEIEHTQSRIHNLGPHVSGTQGGQSHTCTAEGDLQDMPWTSFPLLNKWVHTITQHCEQNQISLLGICYEDFNQHHVQDHTLHQHPHEHYQVQVVQKYSHHRAGSLMCTQLLLLPWRWSLLVHQPDWTSCPLLPQRQAELPSRTGKDGHGHNYACSTMTWRGNLNNAQQNVSME